MAAVGSEHRQRLVVPLLTACLTDGESMKIALQDLTVESIGVAKVRARLVDLQVRSLHGGPPAELTIRCPWLLRYNLSPNPWGRG